MAELKKISGQTVFLAAMLLLAAVVSGYILLAETLGLGRATAAPGGNLTLADIPFDGAKAYEYLKQLCDLGPRPPGSAGMLAQQKLLIDYFQKLGAKVVKQEFRGRDPLSGESLPMTNLIVQWFPDRKERILFVRTMTRGLIQIGIGGIRTGSLWEPTMGRAAWRC